MGFVTTATEIMAFLRSKGFTIETGRGKHGTKAVKGGQKIPIPAHSDDMPLGTAVSILGQAGYSKADFLKWRGH
jgi:predicted RNA binding protein YcfA (HicA-like mRNA interferase family)